MADFVISTRTSHTFRLEGLHDRQPSFLQIPREVFSGKTKLRCIEGVDGQAEAKRSHIIFPCISTARHHHSALPSTLHTQPSPSMSEANKTRRDD